MRSDIWPAKTGAKWDTVMVLEEQEAEGGFSQHSTNSTKNDTQGYEPKPKMLKRDDQVDCSSKLKASVLS